jgi:ribonucleoside-diphosphate reductase alpha chain
MNDYSQFIYKSRYARWNEDLKRREEWPETVQRYCDFWKARFGDLFPYETVYRAIHDFEVMPSMRALMTAGEALDRDEIAGYNCSYIPIDHVRAFDEIMYILMCGTGVGFSVEEHYVNKLPEIPEVLNDSETTIRVPDSRVGWASSYHELLSLLYSGSTPKFDFSRVRPAGARLKTFGGRASGPDPLKALFEFTVRLFNGAMGRRLTTIECHDLVCKIADVVIVGGVRRSALISLSDLGDTRLQSAKSGQWWDANPQRALANNSAVYNGKPSLEGFMEEWQKLYESKSGERGIYNRVSSETQASSTGRRLVDGHSYGTNPCGEIILRPQGLCNLTEVVVRPTDKIEDLRRKVEVATIIGTFQSTLTNFRYIRKIWSKNAQEERLLGVSLTGIFDNPLTCAPNPSDLEDLRNHAIATNNRVADSLGINPSAAITCVKPSGTVSQLVLSSSGIHPAFSRFYQRSVRLDNKDPLCGFLKDQGVKNEPEKFHPENQTVFYFPIKSDGFPAEDVSALEHLELYKTYRKHWCEHNPSITVYYKEDEFLDVGSWVWKNWDDIGGIAFLPHTEHVYEQAPYMKLTEAEYNEAVANLPKIDWEKFKEYEKEDATTGSQELACVGNSCEI